jgi:hypothetical protein
LLRTVTHPFLANLESSDEEVVSDLHVMCGDGHRTKRAHTAFLLTPVLVAFRLKNTTQHTTKEKLVLHVVAYLTNLINEVI